MDRYVAMKINADGSRTRIGGVHDTREQAERAVHEIRQASRNEWAVGVARFDRSTTW